MTFHRNRSSAAALAAPFLFASLLPAQGYIAMTATQVPQTNAPAGVADAGIAARADGSWVVFGGEQANGLLANTFVVNSNVWQPRISLFNPALRTGHQLAFDGVRGDSVMFGGRDLLGNALSDTWVFANDQWSYRPTPSPSARSGHRMCFDAARGVVVLFGGKDAAQTLLGDTWTWNGTAWAQAATAVAPVARHEHGVAYDAYRQKVVLFGGEAASGLRSDVWDWDGTSWVEVVPPLVNGVPFGPFARKQHAMGFDAVAERVVVFGGDRGSTGVGNDSWAFDGANWVGLTAGAANPSVRAKSVVASTASGRLRVFGGVAANTYANDVWELNVPVLPRAFEYGAACVGSGGPLELRLNAGTQAAIGTTLGMKMTGMLSPFAAGVGFYGLSRTSVSGIPLPVDLGLVGIPGCNAYNSADNSMPLGLPSGTPLSTAWNLAIPNDSYFLGIDVYLQGLALEGFGYPRFATVTNGVGMRIGNPVLVTPPGPPATFNMVGIPPGSFLRGSLAGQANEQPVHPVTITRPFWVGKYEVTQAEYQAVMGINPSRWQVAQRPVEMVTWNDAMAYCAALTSTEGAAGRIPVGYQYRLPTEAEWEYFCRAGTMTEWNTGASLVCPQANYGRGVTSICLSNPNQTSIVGSYPANPWGLFDTHGNVWEWCLDSWDGSTSYPSSTISDPYVPNGIYRVFRGGSWNDAADFCRSAYRYVVFPSYADSPVGFRVVLAPVLVP
jgi:formylglycine-generating enzyme required for sulfatase activity